MNHVETGWVALAHTWTVHQSETYSARLIC